LICTCGHNSKNHSLSFFSLYIVQHKVFESVRQFDFSYRTTSHRCARGFAGEHTGPGSGGNITSCLSSAANGSTSGDSGSGTVTAAAATI